MSVNDFVHVRVRPIARKIYHRLRPIKKERSEAKYWKMFHGKLISWYKGEQSFLGVSPPAEEKTITATNLGDSAVLTWYERGKCYYPETLILPPELFRGLKLLDIGAGPMPTAAGFIGAEVYCLEPLLPMYLEAGFPIHYWPGVTYVHAHSEKIPLPRASMDVVISVNAIDHVDDIEKTASEIRRVLKPGGKFAMHVHYHKSTKNEPIELDDDKFRALFGWVAGLRRVHEEAAQTLEKTLPGELFVVWHNVPG